MKFFYKLSTGKSSSESPSGTHNISIPNGWGRQKYLGQFQKAVYNEQIDLNNITHKKEQRTEIRILTAGH